jgi:AcrR family transcriptional regulator
VSARPSPTKPTRPATTAGPPEGPGVAAQPVERTDRLTLELIVDAALRLTKEYGLANVTMRRIADELGVTPMATYHYVRTKEALIELVLEAVVSMIEIPALGTGTWSERLWQLNRASRKVIAAHPGVAEELLSRPPGAASGKTVDASIALLVEAGFTPSSARRAYQMFEACMFGQFVLNRAHRGPDIDDKSYRWSFDTLIAGFEARIAAADRRG